MPDFLIRNLDPDMLEALHTRAAANGRSLQAEIHAILLKELNPGPPPDEWWEQLRRFQKETEGRGIPDMVEWLRKDRESH
jgi:plasmid stability protein